MLPRRSLSAVLLLSPAVLLAQTNQPKVPTTLPRSSEPLQHSPNAQLPVRRVVLYKNGVGFFEHDGRITGDQAITIDFTSSQLDDALQSLTALDLGGGRITGVDYNSTTPIEQQLKNIPLGLDNQPSTEDVYAALRGAPVEVSGIGAAAVSGRIVSYETHSEKTTDGATIDRAFLTVVTDTGAVRTFELTGTTSVRVLDNGLRRDLNEYLTLLASTQSQQIRHLTLQAQGTGPRDIRVSYITEVPVWKTTYRIVFPPEMAPEQAASPSSPSGRPGPLLQGWAVIDNTGGTDWDDVQLSLVAGAPQSFIEPLSQPIYTHRPEVQVPEAVNLAPSIHESGVASTLGSTGEAAMANGAPGQLTEPGAFARRQLHGEGGSSGGIMGGVLGSLGTGPVSGVGYGGGLMHTLQDESASATSAKFDDYFEYTLAQPVTIHKNESALVPILQENVQAERVTLYNPSQPVPLRAIWLTNSGNLTLDRGSFSLFENGEFAGEGITDPIHAGEKRLLSYAVDQAVHVTTESGAFSTHLRHVTVHDGFLTERVEELRHRTYIVHNAAPDARTVIVEHPIESGWKLTSETKPVETSASWDRFNISAQPGATVRLEVAEARILGTRYQLTAIGDDQLRIILTGGDSRAAVEQALAPVLAARAKVQDLETQIEAKQQDIDRITDDSKRLHDNIQGLKDSVEERDLARRYAGEMNSDEDQLQSLRKDRADLEQRRTTARKALDEAIRNLNLDEDIQPPKEKGLSAIDAPSPSLSSPISNP